MSVSNPLLLAHLRRNRIAPTYLFTGTDEQKKDELVLQFIKALNCEKQKFYEPCDCASCRKIEAKNHPDLHWQGEDEKSCSIKIGEIRGILHQAALKPFEGKWKVFILRGAERLTTEASNALLKTLEEPPEHSVFLLLVETKAHLLETIQSRGFEIRVPPAHDPDPMEDQAIRLLKEKGWTAFFEAIKANSRMDLAPILENLMRFFKNQSAEVCETNPSKSRQFLKAFDAVYETQDAVEANTNQKLAMTHLEIELRQAFRE